METLPLILLIGSATTFLTSGLIYADVAKPYPHKSRFELFSTARNHLILTLTNWGALAGVIAGAIWTMSNR